MKKIAIITVLSLFIGLQPNFAFANSYSDIDKDFWAYDKIEALSKEGVLAGYPDGTFKPNENVTRAEFATMVIHGLYQQDAKIENKTDFIDLPETNWAYTRVQQAVNFDLIKGTPEGYFYPNEPVTRAHTISVAVNALATRNITESKARDVLKEVYTDYEQIPNWIIINAGKAEILDMNVKVPNYEKLFNADKSATRAEAAVAVYNMVQQAKLNPNKKLAAAMRPQKGEGFVVNSAVYEGYKITIPAGTKLPVVMIDGVSSQTSKTGEIFLARVPENYLTRDKYIIIVKNSALAGQILDAQIGRYFVRNGKLTMETQTIKTLNKNQEAQICGLVDTTVKRGFWAKIARAIFKGAKINIQNNQIVEIELLKPLVIDATNGKIIKE
ncbi:S-layer homology domain-containing protein [bacterium]|nr:S-layer homology domain-containing protein [bacterium]